MTIEPTLKLHGIWPSPEEELVIRAAVTAHEGAVDIWREWLAQNDIDRLSYGSFRLLPLVYRNLNQYGYDGPEIPKLRGAYRQSWYRNQLLVTRTAEIVGKLEDAGVSAILMKGIPLAIRTYQDLGARSMGDGDLLVPLDQVDRVIAVLEAAGWEPKSRARPLVEVQHAMPYRSQDGLELDIHWFVMISHLYEAAVEPFRDGAVPLAVGGTNLRAFNVTDELLHTCLHGLNWELG